ncbi:MAG: hypothetical protein M0Q94_02470 [Candidatus Cloacimonetes bacterium]|nr:hypothetical protein [Candidatus Cloacimonadota bacterium]
MFPKKGGNNITNSEKICSILCENKFLPEFVFNDLNFEINKSQKELADLAIEINNVLLIIQVKERNKILSKEEERKWLKGTVFNTAIKQVKDSFKLQADSKGIFFKNISGLSSDLSGHKIIPIVVFFNKNINSYSRHYYSEKTNIRINVFDEDDFRLMITSLLIPIDIINYLEYRTYIVPESHIPTIDNLMDVMITNSETNTCIISNKSEEGLINSFYAINRIDNRADENILKYRHFLDIFTARQLDDTDPRILLSKLLLLERDIISKFIERYYSTIELSKNRTINFYRLVLTSGIGFLFVSLNQKNIDIMNHFAYLFKYKNKLNTAIVIWINYEKDIDIDYSIIESDWTYDEVEEKHLIDTGEIVDYL